jgi:phosphoadenosine phosphosulfate reductase
MEQLNLITGQSKTEIAIKFLQDHEPEEGYFLGFSGGKDSIVLYDLAVRSGVNFKAYYSATGIDPPEVVKFIRDQYPDVEWLRPKTSFWTAIKNKGFPTKMARWCCDYDGVVTTSKKIQLKT